MRLVKECTTVDNIRDFISSLSVDSYTKTRNPWKLLVLYHNIV